MGEAELASSFVEEIRKRVLSQQFDTWFRRVTVTHEDDILKIKVPNEFWKTWLETHYFTVMNEALLAASKNGERASQIRVEVVPETAPAEIHPPSDELPRQPRRGNVLTTTTWGAGLNPRYTFENFVVGPSNRFAHAAAMAVAESPSKAYNPLYIYGSVGLGKTHLIQAVCHFHLSVNPRSRVLYVPCESFLNDYISAVQNGTLESFRQLYREADILVIDDIHFLANKERSQEEFFHTFNYLYNAEKQIILSSDSSPQMMANIEKRLLSRFSWGLVAKIDAPVYETKVAIIKKKAAMYGGDLPNDVVEYIASMGIDNIRELEGTVIRVIGYASLSKRKIDMALAREAVEETGQTRTVTLKEIADAVSEVYGVPLEKLRSKSRTRSVARPRQICMYLARKLSDHSLQEIGNFMGGRDHSTVVYANERIEKEVKNNQALRRVIEEILSNLGVVKNILREGKGGER